MARVELSLSVVLVFLVAASNGLTWPPVEQPPVPSNPGEPPNPDDDLCVVAFIDNLVDCLAYLDPESNQTKPSKMWCRGAKTYLKDQPKCVCYLTKAPKDFAGLVDRGKLFKLFRVCKARIPSVARCFSEFLFSLSSVWLSSVPVCNFYIILREVSYAKYCHRSL